MFTSHIYLHSCSLSISLSLANLGLGLGLDLNLDVKGQAGTVVMSLVRSSVSSVLVSRSFRIERILDHVLAGVLDRAATEDSHHGLNKVPRSARDRARVPRDVRARPRRRRGPGSQRVRFLLKTCAAMTQLPIRRFRHPPYIYYLAQYSRYLFGR